MRRTLSLSRRSDGEDWGGGENGEGQRKDTFLILSPSFTERGIPQAVRTGMGVCGMHRQACPSPVRTRKARLFLGLVRSAGTAAGERLLLENKLQEAILRQPITAPSNRGWLALSRLIDFDAATPAGEGMAGSRVGAAVAHRK